MFNPRRINLTNTNLKYRDLSMANLEGINLNKAYLEESNLKEAKNLILEQLSRIKTLYYAILMTGFS